jgi:nitroimidazol reductase NimA-like FMN-containing flavoprotein (pyridoxamine 5'-phosphate oxidase superfamily)
MDRAAVSQAESNAHLEVMDRVECRQLLDGQGVGRIAGTVDGRPVILPINYVVFGDAVLVRARRGGALDRITRNIVVAFEIDGSDRVYHEGWSVLVVGRSAHVTDPAELERLQGLRLLPWAGEGRDLFIRIFLDDVTGRRIHHTEP